LTRLREIALNLEISEIWENMAHFSDNSIVEALNKATVSPWVSAATGDGGEASASSLLRARDVGERIVILSIICDTIVIAGAMLFSFWLRFHTVVREFGVISEITLRDYAGYAAIGAASMLLTLAYRQFYTKSVILRYRRVARQIFESSILWVLGFLSISLILKFEPPVSRLYVAIAGTNILVGLLAMRWFFNRFAHRADVVASLRQRVLFVGWNAETERLAAAFGTDQADAYELVGCVTPTGRDFLRQPPDLRLILGSQEDIADILERRSIDMVMLADMNSAQSEIVGLANLCEKMMVQFKVIPSYFQILVSGLHLETVSGIPILGVSRLPLDQTANIVLKRAVDIVGAFVGLVFSIPLIAIFGAFVYAESPGPILYRQRRLGRNGREFFIFKIRSMKLDAEAQGQVGWTTRNDPRRLRIGRFIRRWNIDEVPQFWNVLAGEMSLVGPRPERPELIRNFKDEIPHYNARHNVKPGITGWAQVKGFRGDTNLGERIKCDLFYLENWNLLLDFQIMVMTFLRRENAC
jgi:exopolysaccharide biosynthesis polyprenyl glycosylphosphotransferase